MSTKKLQILGTSLGNNVYTQPEEPANAPDGALWVDTDAEAQSNSVRIDASLTIEGQAADAKATGDAIRSLSEEMVSQDDVLSVLDEIGVITPVASVGNVLYSDETGKIFVL